MQTATKQGISLFSAYYKLNLMSFQCPWPLQFLALWLNLAIGTKGDAELLRELEL